MSESETLDVTVVSPSPIPVTRQGKRIRVPKVRAVQERARWLLGRHLDKLGRILDGTLTGERRTVGRVLDQETGESKLETVKVETFTASPGEIVKAIETLASLGAIPKNREMQSGLATEDRELVGKFIAALREPVVRAMLSREAPDLLARIDSGEYEEAEVLQVMQTQEVTSS